MKDTKAAIQACSEARASCLQTVEYCRGIGGRHAEASRIRLLLACADLCETTSAFLRRGSRHDATILEACAEVCEACAADCELLGAEDATMRACGTACRRSAASCREMAAHT